MFGAIQANSSQLAFQFYWGEGVDCFTIKSSESLMIIYNFSGYLHSSNASFIFHPNDVGWTCGFPNLLFYSVKNKNQYICINLFFFLFSLKHWNQGKIFLLSPCSDYQTFHKAYNLKVNSQSSWKQAASHLFYFVHLGSSGDPIHWLSDDTNPIHYVIKGMILEFMDFCSKVFQHFFPSALFYEQWSDICCPFIT
jgi:hypothetical protein